MFAPVPAASKVGVTEFIDEWVSAPYEQQEHDRAIIQQGLAWLDGESKQRFGKVFADATPEQQTALVDDIVKTGTDAHKKGFDFFKLFRDRAAGGSASAADASTSDDAPREHSPAMCIDPAIANRLAVKRKRRGAVDLAHGLVHGPG